MKDLIKKLTEAYGPSGYENTMRQIIREEIRGHADEIRTNALGSLVALKHGNGKGKKVMLACADTFRAAAKSPSLSLSSARR